MPAEAWARFKAETFRIVESYGPVVFEGEGRGIWVEGEEKAYTVIATVPDETGTGLFSPLRIIFTALAHGYGQEAVALTLGETVFARAVRE